MPKYEGYQRGRDAVAGTPTSQAVPHPKSTQGGPVTGPSVPKKNPRRMRRGG